MIVVLFGDCAPHVHRLARALSRGLDATVVDGDRTTALRGHPRGTSGWAAVMAALVGEPRGRPHMIATSTLLEASEIVRLGVACPAAIAMRVEPNRATEVDTASGTHQTSFVVSTDDTEQLASQILRHWLVMPDRRAVAAGPSFAATKDVSLGGG